MFSSRRAFEPPASPWRIQRIVVTLRPPGAAPQRQASSPAAGEGQPREIGLEHTIRPRSGFVQGRQEPSHPSHHRAVTMTERQLECLAWAGEGKTAFEIGVILGISARTAEGHLAKACEALGVRKRIQAAIKAREMGLLPSLGR